MGIEIIKSSEIRVGDLIHNDVMRLRVVGEISEYPSRHIGEGEVIEGAEIVYCADGLIENWDELQAAAAAGSNHEAWICNRVDKNDDGIGIWKIQGNDLASWRREAAK